MKASDSIAVLILAAGESTRMGEPKQLLPWKGTTLLGNAIANAKSVCKDNVYVVVGAHAKKIEKSHDSENAVFIYNPNYKSGQGSSLSCGIKYLSEQQKPYKGVLVLLCDQPLISFVYMEEMKKVFDKSEKEIVATKYDARAGVPAIFDQKYFEELKRIKGEKGAKEIINKNLHSTILLDAGGTEIDLDTKIEYEQLIKKLKH